MENWDNISEWLEFPPAAGSLLPPKQGQSPQKLARDSLRWGWGLLESQIWKKAPRATQEGSPSGLESHRNKDHVSPPAFSASCWPSSLCWEHTTFLCSPLHGRICLLRAPKTIHYISTHVVKSVIHLLMIFNIFFQTTQVFPEEASHIKRKTLGGTISF